MLTSAYTYHSVARYSYGWENPNHAAAVILCFLPLIWTIERIVENRNNSTIYSIVVHVAEIVVSIAIGLTYSRGATLGWLLSILFFAFFQPATITPIRSGFAKQSFLLYKISIFTVIVVATGLSHRFADVLAGDGSSTNRLELWRGGLQLIASLPITGWGKGTSGLAFMQWLQNPSSTAGYGGMVNTYLHVAVEFGIPAFAVLCFILLVSILVGFQYERSAIPDKSPLPFGCATGLFGFAIAAIFTTLWTIPSVRWAPCALIALLLYKLRDVKSTQPLFSNSMRWAMGGSALLAVTLYCFAILAEASSRWSLRRTNDNAVRFTSRSNPQSGIEVTILADGRILGPYYGKAIRYGLSQLGTKLHAFTIYPLDVRPTCQLAGYVITFGPRIVDLPEPRTFYKLAALFPVGPPPLGESGLEPSLVILPEYDQIGYSFAWQRWAQSHGYRTLIARGSGQNAEAIWPDLLNQCIE